MEYKTIQGEPDDNNRGPPYREHTDHFAARLTREVAEGWEVVHVTSRIPLSVDQYARPTFFALLQREGES